MQTSPSSSSDLKLDCGPDYVTLVWSDSRSQADTSLFRLGSCFPTTFTPQEVVFNVELDNCNFRRLVSKRSLAKQSMSNYFKLHLDSLL